MAEIATQLVVSMALHQAGTALHPVTADDWSGYPAGSLINYNTIEPGVVVVTLVNKHGMVHIARFLDDELTCETYFAVVYSAPDKDGIRRLLCNFDVPSSWFRRTN